MSRPSEPFTIALAQADSLLFSKEGNLSKAEILINQAASLGAQAIIFPELFLTGYSLQDRAVEMAETIDGPSVNRIAAAARRSRIAVVMGYAELAAGGGQAYDASFAVSAAGQVCGSYRKIHVFQDENSWFLSGDRPCVLDFGLGPVGLLICYDLELPEMARQLALQGATWMAVSTGNMLPNQHLQEIYVQSRAAENRCWVALANRVGREGDLFFFGGSAAADPFGEITAQAGEEETLLLATIDPGRAGPARLNADYLADRKPALYRTWDNPP